MLRSGVPGGCEVTVMSAPWSCRVSTATFSRTSRNTHVSFTGRSTPVTLGETFCEVKSVSRTGFAKLSEVEGRSRQIFSGHPKDHFDCELSPKGQRDERGLRIRGLHGVAYRLSPTDGLAARWVSTHPS